jgi:mannose-6-phosphate isomerase-like protein (cupin superfamily)
MSYNPNIHGKEGKRVARRRQADPKAGKRHSDIVRAMGPRGTNIEDIRNRQSTPHGWKIPYHQGEEFEMYYEYLCARNGTGVIRNDEHDRCIRILVGMLFVTRDSQITTLYAGQAVVMEKGSEYELATSGDTDAELLVCQGANYAATVEQVTQPTKTNPVMTQGPKEAPSRDSRVDPERAKQTALMMKADRERRKQPVQKKTVVNELGQEVPAPSGKAPLPGQSVIGINPKPVGAGGYGD